MAAKLTVEAHRFSGSAEKKITAAGGTTKWLAPRAKKKFIRKPKWQIEAEQAAAGASEAPGGKGKATGKSKAVSPSKAKGTAPEPEGNAPTSEE